MASSSDAINDDDVFSIVGSFVNVFQDCFRSPDVLIYYHVLRNASIRIINKSCAIHLVILYIAQDLNICYNHL